VDVEMDGLDAEGASEERKGGDDGAHDEEE
jgi:hypothetical protein